jgi:hypothetical protein
MIQKNLSTALSCVSSNSFLSFGIVIGLLILAIPSHMYFRWTPWLPPLLKKLLTNTTFQVSYILIAILLSCLSNQGIVLTMYIIHISLFSKFASMDIPDVSEEGFTNGLWNN